MGDARTAEYLKSKTSPSLFGKTEFSESNKGKAEIHLAFLKTLLTTSGNERKRYLEDCVEKMKVVDHNLDPLNMRVMVVSNSKSYASGEIGTIKDITFKMNVMKLKLDIDRFSKGNAEFNGVKRVSTNFFNTDINNAGN